MSHLQSLIVVSGSLSNYITRKVKSERKKKMNCTIINIVNKCVRNNFV